MRLIDATILKTKAKFYHLDGTIKAVVLYSDIMNAPAADVAPVVHGEWIAVPNSGIGNTAKCSCCGKPIYGYKAMNFCPNCGADMRERKGDDAELN